VGEDVTEYEGNGRASKVSLYFYPSLNKEG
jgi:hypothetical protein